MEKVDEFLQEVGKVKDIGGAGKSKIPEATSITRLAHGPFF